MKNKDYKEIRGNQPLSKAAERCIMDKHMKEQELKNLASAFPTIKDCFNDITLMKSLIETTRKRTLKSDTTRIIQTVALVEIVELLKILNEKFDRFIDKGNIIDEEQEEVDEDDTETTDKKSNRKLKSRK